MFQPCPFDIADSVLAANLVELSLKRTALCPLDAAYSTMKAKREFEMTVSRDVDEKDAKSASGMLVFPGLRVKAMSV